MAMKVSEGELDRSQYGSMERVYSGPLRILEEPEVKVDAPQRVQEAKASAPVVEKPGGGRELSLESIFGGQ